MATHAHLVGRGLTAAQFEYGDDETGSATAVATARSTTSSPRPGPRPAYDAPGCVSEALHRAGDRVPLSGQGITARPRHYAGRMGRVTLQTIADQVGVSRMTVSNAFSRPDQLSASLRSTILEAAKNSATSAPTRRPGPWPAARPGPSACC